MTLDKSGGDFSPTTRYRDYAISRDVFHWETQGAASVASARAAVPREPEERLDVLPVRAADAGRAYAFLGPVRYAGTRATDRSRSPGGCCIRCPRRCSTPMLRWHRRDWSRSRISRTARACAPVDDEGYRGRHRQVTGLGSPMHFAFALAKRVANK